MCIGVVATLKSVADEDSSRDKRGNAMFEKSTFQATPSPYVLRLPFGFLALALLLPSFLAFCSGWVVRLQQQPKRTTPGVHEEVTVDIAHTSTSLPAISSSKPVPKTSYSARHFDTSAVTVISESRLAHRDTADCSVDQYGIPVCDDSMPTEVFVVHRDEPAGQHLLVDLENVDTSFLNSQERLAQAMLDLTERHNMVMLSYHCHRLLPMGVTCVGVLSKSHVSFHTWPEEGVITLDFFTSDDQSLLPLLPDFNKLFGIPRETLSSLSRKPAQPRAVWSHKRRGFPKDAKEAADTVWSLLGRMQMEKIKIASVPSNGATIDIWDFKDESHNFGTYHDTDRIVFSNGLMRSRRLGEEAYYETLVHPSMFTHESPRRVAVLGGGGFGATLRETLKHASVESVVLFESDHLVDLSREFLSKWSDCSQLEGSTASCFDDPRVQILSKDPKQWFMEQFMNREIITTSQFDVIIIEQDAVGFLDTSETSAFSTSLFNSLRGLGILAIPTGEAPALFDNLPADEPHLVDVLENLERAGFQDAVVYDEAHGRLHAPRSFVTVFKNRTSHAYWFENEAEVNFKIHRQSAMMKNGASPFKYFDSSVMMSLQFPSRVQEEVWCRQNPGVQGTCIQHGFDPFVPNAPASSVEVQASAVGDNAGRGVYAQKDIPAGAIIALDACVEGMYVAPSSYDLMYDMMENYEHDFFAALVAGYVDGYGWMDSFMGMPSAGVDPGILNFVNHGCNGTYNMGLRLKHDEATAQLGVGPRALGYDDGEDFYDPYSMRHFPAFDCDTSAKSLRVIKAGEEILDNYFVFGGAESGSDWEENLQQLKEMCTGQSTGYITQYEAESDQASI